MIGEERQEGLVMEAAEVPPLHLAKRLVLVRLLVIGKDALGRDAESALRLGVFEALVVDVGPYAEPEVLGERPRGGSPGRHADRAAASEAFLQAEPDCS